MSTKEQVSESRPLYDREVESPIGSRLAWPGTDTRPRSLGLSHAGRILVEEAERYLAFWAVVRADDCEARWTYPYLDDDPQGWRIVGLPTNNLDDR